jgi:Mn2+/Fe2+ NRAMP family transporter
LGCGILSAAALPLATSYAVREGLGFESSAIEQRAPRSWLCPRLPLLKAMPYSQVFNGILLPFVAVYMLPLVNRSRLMGV